MKLIMKRVFLLLLVLLVVAPVSVSAQGKKKKGKKEVSPYIEGRKKVRMTDFDAVWKFTVFSPKNPKNYFCNFDYTSFIDIVAQKKPEWGEFTPVYNYLSANKSATMTVIAIFAVNPNIDDEVKRNTLAACAADEAIASLKAYENWAVQAEMKNKIVYQVAQVDYRYWKGMAYFSEPQPTDDVIHVGLLMAMKNKKVDMFPDATAGAPKFNDIKFFPNDATIVESYTPLIDSIASCLQNNEKYELLLTGYSDNVGTQMYNKQLSRQRAMEIKKMLVLRGILEYRIEIVARGELDPIGDNNTYEGRISNNRVSIKIQ